MNVRTLGWVQNSADTNNLKIVVSLFVFNSDINKYLRETKIPRIIKDEKLQKKFIEYLSNENEIKIPYSALKGKGKETGGTRKSAECSGIVQAAIHSQGEKEYIDDWSADCFLRWAISIGFVYYDNETDLCKISESGIKFTGSQCGSKEEREYLENAYLSYPPVVRVLTLLEKNGHLTKFEIGSELGIIGEAGFTSIPQNLFVQGLSDAKTLEEKSDIRNNVEGDSDKYARMICGWLKNIAWVKREPKEVIETLGSTEYRETINSSFIITLEGKTNLKKALGQSSKKRIPKIVYWEMLATKPTDKIYLRTRRALIINAINSSAKNISQITEILASKGFVENGNTILDDIKSFENIGLNVFEKNGSYKINDEILCLKIPVIKKNMAKSDVSEIKNRIRSKLRSIDHKYLNLIDLSFNGKVDRDFEIQTISLFVNELEFGGLHLGGSRKPDGIIYYEKYGTIVDTKAYSKGYNLPQNQQDEMRRYIEENQKRDISINPNKWWENFPKNIDDFTFLFVSSLFISGISNKIKQISLRTETNGAVINSENLLLFAENVKSGNISYSECFEMLRKNEEVIIYV